MLRCKEANLTVRRSKRGQGIEDLVLLSEEAKYKCYTNFNIFFTEGGEREKKVCEKIGFGNGIDLAWVSALLICTGIKLLPCSQVSAFEDLGLILKAEIFLFSEGASG